VTRNTRIQDESLLFVYTPGMTTTHMGDIDDYSGMVPNTAADTASPASLSRFEFAIASILYQRRTTGSDKEDQDELPSGNHVVVVELGYPRRMVNKQPRPHTNNHHNDNHKYKRNRHFPGELGHSACHRPKTYSRS
jgi:hypothetical protein